MRAAGGISSAGSACARSRSLSADTGNGLGADYRCGAEECQRDWGAARSAVIGTLTVTKDELERNDEHGGEPFTVRLSFLGDLGFFLKPHSSSMVVTRQLKEKKIGRAHV